MNGKHAALFAGGTDLMVQMKYGARAPELVIGLKKIQILRELAYSDTDGLTIGPMVSLQGLWTSAVVRDTFPILAGAASLVGSTQHQFMGTVGGNLCLDSRCLYYNRPVAAQSGNPCHKRGGQTCHAVRGARRCYAVYSADVGTVLYALQARIVVSSADGERSLPLNEFFTGDPMKPNCLEKNELITKIIVPPERASFNRYYKVRRRGSTDFPQIGVAVVAFPQKKEYRVVLNAVAGEPLRFKDLEEMFLCDNLSMHRVADFAEEAVSRVKPVGNVYGSPAYRRKLVGVLIKKAFSEMGVN